MEKILRDEIRVLRDLGRRVAEIAALPRQKQTASLWSQLNGNRRVRPLVWIDQIPWHEMDVDGELALQTRSQSARNWETYLRRTLYRWRHMPADMVVESTIACPLIISDSGFGISEDVDIIRSDPANSVVSRNFHPQIDSEEDLEKIRNPEVSCDRKLSARTLQSAQEIFDSILEVEQQGAMGFWFAPWDELVRWWDVEKALADLVLRPVLVHKAMDRLVNAYLARLDQYESNGLLSSNNRNVRIASGGLGYTEELPQPGREKPAYRASELWGSAAAQIFSAVSPAMHEEFALQYELRWLKRFGLNYYGCCEPLHGKMHILKKIPRLRKVSMSPWVEVEEAAEAVGPDYVFSYKPNPAFLAVDVWHLERSKAELTDLIQSTSKHNCVVEIVMKDISTVRYEPQRLWEWADMAVQMTMQAK